MKSIAITILHLLLTSIAAPIADATEFAIDFTSNGEAVAKVHLAIDGDTAVATVADHQEQFNLKDMTWFDSGSNQWITVDQCQNWLEQSKARTIKGLGLAPAHIRPFLEWSMDPSFTVERSGDVLRLISGQVDYVIEGEAAKDGTDEYFRYAVLNAYKKAITERKLPPYSELKAIEEMRALGYIPRKMSVTIPGIPGSPDIVIEVSQIHE